MLVDASLKFGHREPRPAAKSALRGRNRADPAFSCVGQASGRAGDSGRPSSDLEKRPLDAHGRHSPRAPPTFKLAGVFQASTHGVRSVVVFSSPTCLLNCEGDWKGREGRRRERDAGNAQLGTTLDGAP